MTNVAIPINSVSTGSQANRQAFSALMANGSPRVLGTRSGYCGGRQPSTLTATTTTWTVGPFAAVIDPAFTTTQGPYLISADANNTNTNITAAAGSARIDILYAQVNDTDMGDGSGARNFTVDYLAGTAGSGIPPTTPVRSFVLATINVPASGGGSPTISVNNTFSAASGGVIIVATAAALVAGTAITNPYEGMVAYTLDTNALYFYNGSAWTLFAEDTGWTQPTLGNSWVYLGSKTVPAYRRKNGVVYLEGAMKSGTSGTTIFQLPAGYRPLAVIEFVVLTAGGIANLTIDASGNVSIGGYGAGGGNSEVTLNGVQFIAEQ